MRINEVLSGIEGVGVGSVATVKLTVGRRYHWIKLFPTAVDGSAVPITDASLIIDSVQVYVGGKLQRDVSSAFLKALPAANGVTVASNCLAIYFSEPWRASVMDEQATAFDVHDIRDFTLRINFKPSGIVSPALSGIACWDNGRARLPDGTIVYNIIKQEPFSWNAGVGFQEVTNLPLDLPIQRLWLTGASSSQITKLDVTADDVRVHEATEAQNNEILADYRLAGSAFDYSYVTDPHQQLFDSLMVRRALTARIYTASAGLIKGILERRSGSFL